MTKPDDEYKFAVSAAADVDIQRICTEAPEGVDAILVTGGPSGGGVNGALLLLRGDFIGRFDLADQINLVNEPLGAYWGYGKLCASPMRGEVVFVVSSDITEYPLPGGWRGSPLAHTAITSALIELEKARQHLSIKRTVTVRYV